MWGGLEFYLVQVIMWISFYIPWILSQLSNILSRITWCEPVNRDRDGVFLLELINLRSVIFYTENGCHREYDQRLNKMSKAFYFFQLSLFQTWVSPESLDLVPGGLLSLTEGSRPARILSTAIIFIYIPRIFIFLQFCFIQPLSSPIQKKSGRSKD